MDASATCRRAAAVLLTLTALCALSGAIAAPQSITVGRLKLVPCNSDYNGYCGAIERPLDPSGAVKGRISIGFEYYPRSDQAHSRLGTLLPQEGGPGYSSTGTRDFYLSLFDALRDRRDVLIIDKRGTGLSEAIDCPDLQSGATDLGAVAECGAQLKGTAWFYGTDYAAADIVAVLDALDIDDVDFYGDSYGTFVGQVLAGLFPKHLRSIILDSAYPVRPPDPWFASDWAAAWSGIDLSCTRSPSCRSLGGSATGRMRQLVDHVRDRPLEGEAPDGNGERRVTTLDTGALINVIDAAGYGPPVYRDLDAAARAWIDSGDALPLLRLSAEQSTPSVDAAVDYSYGLAAAVTCSDYPLNYDLTASRKIRNAQYANALAAARQNRPELFAPFTVEEGVDSQVYITPLDSCLPWPAPPRSLSPGAPGAPLPPRVQFPAVPTLVLSGDLDSITSVEDASETAAQFPDAVHVVVPNLGHVVANGDFIGCTLGIVQHFVEHLAAGNTACVRQVRPVRTVPRFARKASDLKPLTPLPGNQAAAAQRRLAAAGLEAVGDVIARYYVTLAPAGAGLRGGSFSYSATDAGYDFTLDDVRWTEDVAVSGTVSWDFTTAVIKARITLKSAGRPAGRLTVSWVDSDVDAVATVSGEVQGATLRARRIAP